MPTLKINGADIHYEDTGGGPQCVVFSHGLFWSGRMYDAQIAALRARFRCIAFDHRGQGRSAPYYEPYDIEQLYEDAAALITALGAAPCHYVGLSMGGFVGMRVAARKPEMVRSLALLDTAADAEPGFKRFKYTLLGAVAPLTGMRPMLGQTMAAMFGAAFLSDPARAEEREEMKRRLMANDLRSSINALMAVCRRKPVEAELPSIRCPTLVLSGEDDRSVSPARSERTAKQIPGAEFRLVPRAGHSSTMEEPAAVAAALAAFYDRVA